MNILSKNKKLLNPCGENITIFHVEEGEEIKKGDFVVANTRTWLASRPKKQSGYYSVGRAVEVITSEDGTDIVICKDGIYIMKNSCRHEHKIIRNNVARACYFENEDTVSLENINATRVGEIISVADDGVLVRIDVNEGSGMQW